MDNANDTSEAARYWRTVVASNGSSTHQLVSPQETDYVIRGVAALSVCATYTTVTPEVPMKKSEKWIVLAHANGTVVNRYEAEEDALADAARLAAKTGEEYVVFHAVKRVRPKPTDIETVDA